MRRHQNAVAKAMQLLEEHVVVLEEKHQDVQGLHAAAENTGTTGLVVDIMSAQGLEHMNHFTDDHPCCVCEVRHTDGSTSRVETKAVTEGDTLSPVWAERFEFENWQPGEALQFTILAQGLLGSKKEGKAELLSESFYPHGFNGLLPISGLQEAVLEVIVQAVEEAPVLTQPVPTTQPTSQVTGTIAYMGTTYSAPTVSSASSGGVQAYVASMSSMKPTVLPVLSAPTHPSSQMQPCILPGSQVFTVAPAPGTTAPGKLVVSIFQASGLNHMNHFIGDHPYVVCEVKHLDKNLEKTRAETQPVMEGDTLNPTWDETLELEPWYPGEPLEFTVLDKGLIGSKTEGRATLPAELFTLDSSGFTGNLRISGLQGALLNIAVQVMPSADAGERSLATRELAPTTSTTSAAELADTDVTTKKKSKKLKISRKSKGCC